MTLKSTETVRYAVREIRTIKATTQEVALTHPLDAATTQEDADKIIAARTDDYETRITALETEIDGGSY